MLALVVGALALPLPSHAQSTCELSVEANDAMAFSAKELSVDASCETVTVTLQHVGTLARNIMGHNWVLTRTADMMGVANDGVSAGIDGKYVPANDSRVIAATEVIGGGESTTVSFPGSALEAGGDYTFFCSFPGHWAIMVGKLVVAAP